MGKTLLYLASPYSHEDETIRCERFVAAQKATLQLMRSGFLVYSPIVYSHPLAVAGDLPLGWDYWCDMDNRMIAACDGLYVLPLEGWIESRGVQEEIRIAERLQKPTVFASWLVKPETPKKGD